MASNWRIHHSLQDELQTFWRLVNASVLKKWIKGERLCVWWDFGAARCCPVCCCPFIWYEYLVWILNICQPDNVLKMPSPQRYAAWVKEGQLASWIVEHVHALMLYRSVSIDILISTCIYKMSIKMSIDADLYKSLCTHVWTHVFDHVYRCMPYK